MKRTARCGHDYESSSAAGRTRKKCDACLKGSEPVQAQSWWVRHGYQDRWSEAMGDTK